MSTPTPTPTPTNASAAGAAELQQASNDVLLSVGTTMDVVPVAIVVSVAVVTVGAILPFARQLGKYRAVERVVSVVVSTVGYVLKGIVTMLVISVVAIPAYYFMTLDSSTQQVALEYVIGGVVVVIALGLVGYLADTAAKAYISGHPTAEEWGDLFPDTDDEPDAVTDGGENS